MNTNNPSEVEIKEIVDRVLLLKKNPKSAFISYTWDSDEHKQWVRYLADQLIQAGFEVIIDQIEQTDWARVSIYGIRGCNNIIFISTETTWERCAKSDEYEGDFQRDGYFLDERQMFNANFRPPQKAVTLYRSGVHCSNCYPIIDFGNGADHGKAFIILILFLLSPWNNEGTFGSPMFLDTDKEMSEYQPGEQINIHFVPLEKYSRANDFVGVKFVRY
ncbi:MAG: hypothetical protein EHM20_02225 [Alphaproteobacteria bacterium]|nr:MAG: hypothetical protein EHM20_02225 [Alphaproteobacteria bacterium]